MNFGLLPKFEFSLLFQRVCGRTNTLYWPNKAQRKKVMWSKISLSQSVCTGLPLRLGPFLKELFVIGYLHTPCPSQSEAITPAEDAVLQTATVYVFNSTVFPPSQQSIKCPCLLQCPSSGVVPFIRRLNAISRHPLPKPVAGLKIPSYLISPLLPWSACPFIWLQAQPVIDQLVN